jgi:hypothetical protein
VISVISIVDDDLMVREATLVLLMAMVRAGRDADLGQRFSLRRFGQIVSSASLPNNDN